MRATPDMMAALGLRYAAARHSASKAWAEYRHARHDMGKLRVYARRLRHCERLKRLLGKMTLIS